MSGLRSGVSKLIRNVAAYGRIRYASTVPSAKNTRAIGIHGRTIAPLVGREARAR